MNIKTSQIIVENRGRKEFKDIDKLAESIKKCGLIHPIVVQQREDGKYLLIAGERRLRAAMFAGKSEVPITLKEGVPPELLTEMELEENVQRVDLHWSEKADLLLKLDSFKRRRATGNEDAIYGDRRKGYDLQKTAEAANIPVGTAAHDLQLAKDMQQNPELAKKVKHLPKVMARKQLKVLMDSEAAKRALADRELVVVPSLKLGPCQELIKSLPDASVDLVITDPPFACEDLNVVGKKRGYGFDDGNMGSEDEMRSVYDTLFPELFRVLKEGSHVYIFHTMSWYARLHEELRTVGFDTDDRPVIWYKGQTTNKPTDWHYMPSYEAILFAIKPPKGRPLMKPRSDVIQVAPLHHLKRIHALQKPPELLRVLIENSSSIGDVVLDPFAGSASTLSAAQTLNRKSIGFELNEDNYARAQKFLQEGAV